MVIPEELMALVYYVEHIDCLRGYHGPRHVGLVIQPYVRVDHRWGTTVALHQCNFESDICRERSARKCFSATSLIAKFMEKIWRLMDHTFC